MAMPQTITAVRHVYADGQFKRMLINGEWVKSASGKTFDSRNPATGDLLATVAEGDAEDINRAVAAARAAFEGPWSKFKPYERQALLLKLADLVEKHFDELSTLDTLDMGAPLTRTRATRQRVLGMLRWYAGMAVSIHGETIENSLPGEYFSYTLKEPIGVVGAIIPWNGPLGASIWKIGPALATGCTVILKPAEEAPLTPLRLGELLMDAGVPPGVVNIVPGYGETAGAALAAHPGVDKIAFTGSTEVGKIILQAAAGNLKKVSLELGGKSPNVVLGDVDLDAAIAGSASAIFFNHGQCCCAGSRLYVEDSIFDKVVDGVAEHANKIKVGSGQDDSNDMGPLVSEEQLNRVCGFLESGRSEGARAVAGGSRHGDKGYFVKPTVLVNTNEKMKVVQEEIFGPVVTAIPFRNVEEIAAKANNSIYGLAAGVWTCDIKKAHRIASLLRAGTVWINCYNVFDAALPFGGYKQSGWGREMGHEVLEQYTEVKAVCTPIS